VGGNEGRTHLCLGNSLRLEQLDDPADLLPRRLLVPQRVQDRQPQLGLGRDLGRRDSLADGLRAGADKAQVRFSACTCDPEKEGRRTRRSGPWLSLLARLCSSSLTWSSPRALTSRLSSPTSATCLDTFEPSLRNSGYSSMNLRGVRAMRLVSGAKHGERGGRGSRNGDTHRFMSATVSILPAWLVALRVL